MTDSTTPTTDPSLRSWIESAEDPSTDFPVQNLPFGSFSRDGDGERRLGVAIGDRVLDLRACVEAELLEALDGPTRCALCAPTLNDFIGLGRPRWIAAREAIQSLLLADTAGLRDDAALQTACLAAIDEVTMHLPMDVGDYTDFYASLHHATNVGSMFRPDNPLMPNWKHLPVGYHGRASTLVPSGTPIVRPHGQTRPNDEEPPVFGPIRLFDYELEVGFVLGPGNPMGARIRVEDAREHLFGVVIVNDWSARDVQKWEYQPLGPFNSKNFGTTVSPWVVTLEALAPFTVPGPPRTEDDPKNLDYLVWADDFQFDLTLEVEIVSEKMRDAGSAPHRISRGTYRDMYWTACQMIAHHTSTGCAINPGDLIASGTVSGTTEDSRGCLLERTWRGANPIDLPDGTQRTFLQDGDDVNLRGFCEREGVRRIGFGECSGEILPARG